MTTLCVPGISHSTDFDGERCHCGAFTREDLLSISHAEWTARLEAERAAAEREARRLAGCE
jgi:hypothetical protein